MSHVDEGTLHAYLDGELPSTERAALEAHLAGCAACHGNLIEERSLRERASAVLGSARPVERPAPALDQLRREPKRSPWRVRRSFAWAASIALALGVGYYMSPNGRVPAADHMSQPIAVAKQRADANDEERDKSPAATAAQSAPAHAPAATRLRYEQRSARPTDAVAAAESKLDSTAKTPALGLANAAAPAPKAADSARIDARVASGTVAAAQRDQPAPAPAAGAPTFIVDGSAARVLPATNWPVISRRMAKSILGEEPVGLPGLATRRFRRVPGTEGTIVVEQAIDSSTVIQIFQRTAYPYDSTGGGYANEGRLRVRGYASEEQARERGNRLFARFVKGLRVEITGPLSPDSLNRLLEQVAPLP